MIEAVALAPSFKDRLTMFSFLKSKSSMVGQERSLPGRPDPIPTSDFHHVSGRPLKGPHPDGTCMAMFGMGCFWGVERLFWQSDGVWVTSVGYAGGYTPNPTYKEVCTGLTGHNEVVQVIYEPSRISYGSLLKLFWENHDPTQGMRQGNDVGTQYRSGIYAYGQDQLEEALASRSRYASAIGGAGLGKIATEVLEAPQYFFAEDYHQQYLAKNPLGYCNIRGTGIECPAG